MGTGLLITVVMLGILLGLFSRQALKSTDKQPVQDSHEEESNAHQDETSNPHPHAM